MNFENFVASWFPFIPRAVRLWAPVVVCMAAIFYVSSLSNPPLPDEVDDKTAHIAAYLGLGVVVVRACAGGLPARIGVRVALLAMAMTIAYGATDEYHQSFVAGRTEDVLDLRADAIGAAIAVAACWAWGIISLRSVPHGAAP